MTRASNAGLTLISRANAASETEYLTQWSTRWQAYSLIGGHVEEGESFGTACLREISEELECDQTDVQLAPYPYARLRFRQYSLAAREETDYHWQVFVASVAEQVLNQLPENCRWLTAEHIRSGRAADGKPIAEQVQRVLKAVDEAEFNVFVFYSHTDNADGGVKARSFYEKALEVSERLAASAPENADYARDLWVSYFRLAEFGTEISSTAARTWYQRAHDILQSMVDRGWFVSEQDFQGLAYIKQKLDK